MVALNTRRQDQSKNNNNIKNGKRAPVAEFKSTYFRPLNFNQNDLKSYGIAIAIMKQLYRDGGIRSFYKGYFATLICFVPSSACWWMLYQHFNEFLFSSKLTKDMPYMFLNSMAGILSGASASIMTNPLDLLRTNIQVHRPSSYKSAVKYLWKEDKWRIFSKGLSARLTHSCISSGLIVIGYETMKRFSLDDKYRDQLGWWYSDDLNGNKSTQLVATTLLRDIEMYMYILFVFFLFFVIIVMIFVVVDVLVNKHPPLASYLVHTLCVLHNKCFYM